MNNLEKIKAAWAMGWAAKFKRNGREFIVLRTNEGLSGTFRIATYDDKSGRVMDYWQSPHEDENIEITGYLYAGQLAGNEPIPEGQRFRVKTNGREGVLLHASETGVLLKGMATKAFIEVEPVFD